MSAPLPTVMVHHPLDPDVRMLINKSDLTDDHIPWGHYADEAGKDDEPLTTDSMRVAKGPRGKWYVKLGKDNVEGPFETEDEAQAAIA